MIIQISRDPLQEKKKILRKCIRRAIKRCLKCKSYKTPYDKVWSAAISCLSLTDTIEPYQFTTFNNWKVTIFREEIHQANEQCLNNLPKEEIEAIILEFYRYHLCCYLLEAKWEEKGITPEMMIGLYVGYRANLNLEFFQSLEPAFEEMKMSIEFCHAMIDSRGNIVRRLRLILKEANIELEDQSVTNSLIGLNDIPRPELLTSQ